MRVLLVLGAFSCAAVVFASSTALAEDDFKRPEPPDNLASLGSKIQRTMTLLATSTPQKRNHVRVLFYGQSVTRNPWWQDVAEHLRETYPHADLDIQNLAIGGYSAPVLIHTAEFDLYPYYPDLLIFHVYGGVEGGEQEKIIEKVRRTTTSEVLLWTSHFRWPRDLPRDGDPNDPAARSLTEQDEVRTAMIREIAAKHGCELAEVRERLRKHLDENGLFPKDTLNDSVHPNKLGNFLIGELIKPSLRYDPKFPSDCWRDMVREVPVDDPSVGRGADGSLELKFDGNRVDVIAARPNDGDPGTAKVLIDGRPPSELPELYYHARPSNAPHDGVRPAINSIGHQAPLILEKWTAKLLECDPEKNILRYEVIGSETGPDGQGDHLTRFVSNSGRVVIEPRMWMVCWAVKYRKKPLPDDFEVCWEVKPLFKDVYQAPETEDPTKESAVTLAQGLTNGKHTLRLVPNDDGPLAVKMFRVYRPPLR
ncbi:MAG: SGNH/GDSL hydrolase family protein [Planctomycetes bacterium]|nr:SGNH/GDSL hydrolase family protein [Planctomycetota bacterium]